MTSKFIKLVALLFVAVVVSAQDIQNAELTIAKPIPPPIGLCTQAYEMYLKDGPGCPQTCQFLNQDCYANKPKFAPGCYCLPGYVRNSNNVCVEGNAFCGNCTANEYYTANGSPCQTECSTLGKPCLIVNKRAPQGCYCKAGYARNTRGVCISIDYCPSEFIFYIKLLKQKCVLIPNFFKQPSDVLKMKITFDMAFVKRHVIVHMDIVHLIVRPLVAIAKLTMFGIKESAFHLTNVQV